MYRHISNISRTKWSPTTSMWLTILLPTKVWHIVEAWRYVENSCVFLWHVCIVIYDVYNGICMAGVYLLSGKMSYRQISRSREDARVDIIMTVSLWNLTSLPTAYCRAIGKVQSQLSRLRNFTRSCGKTSNRLVNWGPGYTLLRDAHNHT